MDKTKMITRTISRSRPNSVSPEQSDKLAKNLKKDTGKGVIRLGEKHQANVSSCISNGMSEKPEEEEEEIGATLVWSPTDELSDAKVDEYELIAKNKYGYNKEQALGMLFWHKYDVDTALKDMANFTPMPDDWSVEDKVLFEQAVEFHGKQFHRIKQMLPHKPISSLVKQFYSWKRFRHQFSRIDHTADQGDRGQEGTSQINKVHTVRIQDTEAGETRKCSNCGVHSSEVYADVRGTLCSDCFNSWRQNKEMPQAGKRKEDGLHSRHTAVKHRRRPPKGMFLDSKTLVTMVTSPPNHTTTMLKGLDCKIQNVKGQVQNNKQILESQKEKLGSGVDEFRPAELPQKISPRWTREELLLALQGIRQYGLDFAAIAELVGTKLERHVRSFYIKYRGAYNVDGILAEHQTRNASRHEQTPALPSSILPTAQLTSQAVKDTMQTGSATDLTSAVPLIAHTHPCRQL